MTTDEDGNFVVELATPEGGDAAMNLQRMCANLLHRNELVDCTIACSDGQLQAHRIVLSSSSQYLYNLFNGTPWPRPCSHPVVMLRKSCVSDVKTALEFIYSGKVMATKIRIPALLDIASELGCQSLGTAIESAIQSDEVDMFRRRLSDSRVGSVVEEEPPTKSLPAKNDSAVAIKNEPVEDVQLDVGVDIDLSSSKTIYLVRNGGECTDETGDAAGASESIHIQYDKGESFVYTNEDLGMTMDHAGDSDNNESVDEDLDISNTSALNLSSAECGSVKTEKEDGEFAEMPANCPWCAQAFTNLNQLQRHIKTHVGSSKPYMCSYCNNTFARSAHLKRHLRTHTGEKPYKCTICQRPFARQDKLKVHLERHVQNSTKNTNTAMTITSYPPQSISQSTGGQVPIKLLIPTGSTCGSSKPNFPNNGIGKASSADHPSPWEKNNLSTLSKNPLNAFPCLKILTSSGTTTIIASNNNPLGVSPEPTSSC